MNDFTSATKKLKAVIAFLTALEKWSRAGPANSALLPLTQEGNKMNDFTSATKQLEAVMTYLNALEKYVKNIEDDLVTAAADAAAINIERQEVVATLYDIHGKVVLITDDKYFPKVLP